MGILIFFYKKKAAAETARLNYIYCQSITLSYFEFSILIFNSVCFVFSERLWLAGLYEI